MLVPLLVFIVISVLVYASFVKLAARVLRYEITWSSGFLFAAIVLSLVVISRFLASDVGQPLAMAVARAIVLFVGLLVFGGWFFSQRGKDRSSGLLGWRGGLCLTGLAFGMMLIVGFALVLPVQIFLSKHLPPPP
jgi:hypothetical protein